MELDTSSAGDPTAHGQPFPNSRPTPGPSRPYTRQSAVNSPGAAWVLTAWLLCRGSREIGRGVGSQRLWSGPPQPPWPGRPQGQKEVV